MQELGWTERLADGWIGSLWKFQAGVWLGSWTGPKICWPGGTAMRGSMRRGMATRAGVGDVTVRRPEPACVGRHARALGDKG